MKISVKTEDTNVKHGETKQSIVSCLRAYCVYSVRRRNKRGVDKMAQLVKSLLYKPNNPDLIPWTIAKVKKKTDSKKVIL